MGMFLCPKCKNITRCLQQKFWSKDLKRYLYEHYCCDICRREYIIRNGLITHFDEKGNFIQSGEL